MKTKTKIPVISQGLKDAVVAFIAAKAYVETIRPKVEAYQAAVLADAQIRYSDEFAPEFVGIITNMKDSWMMDGLDAEDFYPKLDAARDAAGFVGFEPGHCPLLHAEYDVIKAKRLICDESAYFTGVNADRATSHFEIFDKFVETTIRFVLSVCPDITAKSVMAATARAPSLLP